jgi:hypothetical protein
MLSPLLALALVPATLPADAEDPARLLPADTLIYFGSTSVQASWEASKNTAMAHILDEAEVKAFLNEPLSAANQVIAAGLDMMKSEADQLQAAAADLGIGADFSLDEMDSFIELGSSSAPPLGQMFFALTHIGMPSGESPVPDLGLALGVELVGQDVSDMISTMWGQIPLPDSNDSHAGVQYLGKASPMASIYLAVLGEMVVVSTSQQTLHGVIDRWQGSEAAGPNLTQASEYNLMIQSAGGLRPGGSSWFVRAAPLAGIARMALAMGLPASGEMSPEEAQKMIGVYDSMGFGALGMLGGTSSVGSDGMIHGTTIAAIDDSVPGLISKLTKPGAPVDISLFGQIPGDAIGASAASIGSQFADAYDYCFGLLEEMEPGGAAEAKQALEALMGEYDLRDDVLANINHHMVNYSVPGQGLMGAPDTVMRMGIRDGDRFVGALGTLLDAVSGEIGMPLSLQTVEHEGGSFYRIDLSATPAGMMMQPAFAMKGGEMVFSTSERQLKTLLNGGSIDESLWDNERLQSFAKNLDGKGNVSALAYTDVRASFGTQYQQLAGMAAMIPGLSALPVDMSKLPAESTIGAHLDESFSGSYRTDDGLEVSRSISQFQMGDFLPLLLIGGAIYAGNEMGISIEEMVAEVDPSELVQNDLRELKASITVFKISEAGYPSSLDDLLRPLADFPGGAYQHDSLPMDPWGNGYRFAMETHPKKGKLLPKLWSLGPNGMDESGEGDDILKF